MKSIQMFLKVYQLENLYGFIYNSVTDEISNLKSITATLNLSFLKRSEPKQNKEKNINQIKINK